MDLWPNFKRQQCVWPITTYFSNHTSHLFSFEAVLEIAGRPCRKNITALTAYLSTPRLRGFIVLIFRQTIRWEWRYIHKLNERLRAYVEFSVPLSVELIPRFFMPFFFGKIVLLLPSAEVLTVSDKYDTHGCPIIENICHVEITKMDRLKFENASLSASWAENLNHWNLHRALIFKKKKKFQDLSLMNSRILIGFCWKESISGRIIPTWGLVFACIRAGCPPSNRQNTREPHSAYDERPAAVMTSLWNGYLLCCRVSLFCGEWVRKPSLVFWYGGLALGVIISLASLWLTGRWAWRKSPQPTIETEPKHFI